MYTENASKNRPGGYQLLNLPNKTVTIMRNTEDGIRCYCSILDEYFKRIPMKAFEEDIFYLRPLTRFENQAVWFTSVPVGKNKNFKLLFLPCARKPIYKGTCKTNHSLRATGAIELYLAGVPEKIIKERTGHRSLESLRMYEKTNTSQHKAVCNILTSKKDTKFNSFNSEMARLTLQQLTQLSRTQAHYAILFLQQ